MGNKKAFVNPFYYAQGKLSGAKKLDPMRPMRQMERRAEQAAMMQEEELDKQRMMEEARKAEEEDRIKRKRLQSLTGRRSLLITSSPMGTTDELGGGGMYG
jgi:hypothetical protein